MLQNIHLLASLKHTVRQSIRMNHFVLKAGMLVCIQCCNVQSHAQDMDQTRYDFVHPRLHTTAQQRAKVHRLTSIGQASFKQGVVVPVFGVSIDNPMQAGLLADFKPCTVKTCTFKMTIPDQQVRQLALYQINGVGMVLAPKAWTTIEAEMGANGSSRLVMLSADGKQGLSATNTSACVGCALSAASLYFDEARREALANEFTAYSTTNVPVNTVPLNKYTVAFSYQLPKQYPTHGIAKFYGMQQDIVNFNQISVVVNPQQKALATTLLNFYHFIH